MSQMGVPYSWGGGNAAGPSNGIDCGAGTVGFDCSGLILYAFAGVGIKLPHYSGSQYNMGRKIPSAQMRRGDVIFYGPGGSQHVTLYLGNGQMLEAPYTGSTVKISPGAHQRHDAVRRPLHRVLTELIAMSRNASRRLTSSGRSLTALALALGFASPASADPGEWDPTLPKMLSAGAPGDPVAIANASLQVTQQAAADHHGPGSQVPVRPRASAAGPADGAARRPGPRSAGHRVRDPPRRLAARACRTPGAAARSTGPARASTRTPARSATTARASPATPSPASACRSRSTPATSTTPAGTIAPSQAKRGDLIFYGPGGSQHVAIYLGNGQMLEASSARRPGHRQPGAHRGHDAVPDPHHRDLTGPALDAPANGARRRIPERLE